MLLSEAWRSSPTLGRLIALAAAIAALACTLVASVPLATGVALAATVPAVVVDIHTRRLPDLLVGAAAVAGIAVLVVDVTTGGSVPLAGIVLGAVVMSGPMFLLHVASPRSMGFGDVKLGLVLGGALGAVDWQLALSGLALAAGLTAVVALLRRRDTVAFGPGLLVGALLAVACHGMLLPDAVPGSDSSSILPAIAHGATVGR